MTIDSWFANLQGLVCGLMLCACGGGGGMAAPSGPGAAADPTAQELQCQAAGWTREAVTPAGLQRLVLWKAPAAWPRGALVILHGGGGSHTNFCVANVDAIAAQVRFTDMALAQGFAVFLIDSSDQVSDNEGRLCGKVWDDEARARAGPKPPFRQFHHAQDGINDRSCVAKVRAQLLARGYPEEPPFMLDAGPRSDAVHVWLDDYNAPLLAFFASRLR